MGENYVTALISRQLYHWLQLKSQQLIAIACVLALLFCPALCPVLTGIWTGWVGRNKPLSKITKISKSSVGIVSKDHLKEWVQVKNTSGCFSWICHRFEWQVPCQRQNGQWQLKQEVAQTTAVGRIWAGPLRTEMFWGVSPCCNLRPLTRSPKSNRPNA